MIFGLVGLALLGWQLFRALSTMEIEMRGGRVMRRDEQPIQFWLAVAAHLPMLAVCTWIVLSGIDRGLTN
jgi:hypothetical protein